MGKALRAAELVQALADLEVVDVHQHIGSWGAFGGQGGSGALDEALDLGYRFGFMEGFGIDHAIVHPSQQMASDVASVSARNDEAVEAVARSEGRFLAALASLPLISEEALSNEWDRLAGAPISGLSFHHRFLAKPLDTPLMDAVCERARDRGIPVVVHCVAESQLTALWRLSRVARRWPSVKFLALCAFSGSSQAQHAVEVAEERDNVYFETSLMATVPALIDEFCRVAGSHRLLYGSDLYTNPKPIYNCPVTLFELLASPLPAADIARIVGQNAREFFGVEPGGSRAEAAASPVAGRP